MTKDQERGSSTLADQQDKMVEESLEVFGGSCSRGAWRQFFESTGVIFFVNKNKKLQIWKLCDFPKNVFKTHFFQKPGPCLLLSLLLSWHTWPLPQPSITWMSDCKLHISSFDKRTLHVRMYLDDKAIKTCSLHISSYDQSTLHVRMYLDYQGIKNTQLDSVSDW